MIVFRFHRYRPIGCEFRVEQQQQKKRKKNDNNARAKMGGKNRIRKLTRSRHTMRDIACSLVHDLDSRIFLFPKIGSIQIVLFSRSIHITWRIFVIIFIRCITLLCLNLRSTKNIFSVFFVGRKFNFESITVRNDAT